MKRTHSVLLYDTSPETGWADDLQRILTSANRDWIVYRETEQQNLSFDEQVERLDPTIVLLIFRAGYAEKAERCVLDGNQVAGGPVIVVTEPTSGPLTHFLKGPVVDFLLPPFREEDVIFRVARWLEEPTERSLAATSLKERFGLRQFVGKSAALLAELRKLPRFARSDASVFIAGETGTGKEICARAVHHLSHRANGPFVPVNSGAIPIDLIENELFGHESGAYTGARGAQRGLLEEAEGGTLFLDEIDALPTVAQVKLLRLLQEREYRPLGSRKTRHANVRVIAACNVDAPEALRSGRLRQDLYYRLNVLRLRLPPLRERREDIPLLARHFVDLGIAGVEGRAQEFAPAALAKLQRHDWPGNIRELENVIQRAMLLTDGPVIEATAIDLGFSEQPLEASAPESFRKIKARVVEQFERNYVRELLLSNDGNITAAARMAVKNRRAFFALMRKHHISVKSNRDGQVKVVIPSDENVRLPEGL